MQACDFMARTGRRSNNFCRHALEPKSVPTHKNSSSRWNPTPPARHKTPHLPVSFRMSKRKSLWIQNHPQKTPQKMTTHTSSPKCNTQLMQNSILQQQTVPRFLARTRRLQRWENFEMWKNIKKQLIHDLWRKESSGGPQLQKYQHFCMKFWYSIFPFISFYNSIQEFNIKNHALYPTSLLTTSLCVLEDSFSLLLWCNLWWYLLPTPRYQSLAIPDSL